MADVPKDLLQQIKRLEELFTVDTKKLKEVTEHFVKELEKGEFSSSSSIQTLLTILRPQCRGW